MEALGLAIILVAILLVVAAVNHSYGPAWQKLTT